MRYIKSELQDINLWLRINVRNVSLLFCDGNKKPELKDANSEFYMNLFNLLFIHSFIKDLLQSILINNKITIAFLLSANLD